MTDKSKDVVDMGDTDPNKGTKSGDAPKPEKIDVGGKSYEVPAEVAKALAAATKAAEEAGASAKEVETRLKAQLDELIKKLPPDPKATATDPDDYSTLLFTDPNAALKTLRDGLKKEILAEVNAETTKFNSQKEFWNSFYEEFPELKGDDLVVRAVMGRDMAALAPLKIPATVKKLGEATQKHLMDRGGERKSAKKTPQAEGGTEKGGKHSNKGKESEQSPAPGGITAVLKQRQADRANARRGAA